jgi:2-C-methyl-D-erythritol 4-phosphate cytidylyltransferase
VSDARVVAIVVAGGTGERLGLAGGKQLAPVAGKPVVSWTLAALDACPDVDAIVLVCHPDRVEEFRATAVTPYGFATPVALVAGGDTRQASVAAGLAAVPATAEAIVVQDGARPLLTPELVARTLEVLDSTPNVDGAVIAYPSSDTLKLVEDRHVVSTPDRSVIWAVQTPQVFRADALRDAYDAAEADGFLGTDDASLLERAGQTVLVVEGPRDNIKVTVAEDLALAEAIFAFRAQGEERS